MARPTGPDGRRHYLGTRRLKRDAQLLIDAAYEQWEQEPFRRDTVGEYAKDWTERYPRSERTNYDRNSKIRQLLDVEVEGVPFKDWPLVDLRRRHATALVDHMLRDQGRAVEGARNILRVLSVMAEDAINNDEILEVNPFKGVKLRASDPRATKAKREPQIWTPEEMHEFAASGGVYAPQIRMLADCGLRIGEMLGLRRELQDLKAGIFTVKGTAWNGRLVESSETKKHDRQGPIPPTCLAMLRSMPTQIDSEWLFPTPGGGVFNHSGGLLWRYDNWRRDVWLPTCEAAGIDPTPQEFRASWETHLLAAGANTDDVAAIAGHSINVQAEHYRQALHRSSEFIKAAIG